jgi:Uma2 family endonuclease
VVYVAELDRGFLPDVVVICGTPEEAPNKPSGVTNPTVIFEVLSTGTQRFDRTTKLEAYQRLASLKAYVLLHQDEPKAEVFHRDNGWTREEQVGGVLQLPLDISVDLDQL